MKRIGIIIFSFLTVILFSEEYRFVINTGHLSSSAYLQFDEGTQYVISVSDSGELLLLTADTRKVLKNINITNDRILDLSFNPLYSELAIVTYSDMDFQLEVWDWHRGVRLFEKTLKDKPIYLKYTMAGKNLILGQSEIPSIRFLDHQTGREKDWFNRSSQLFQDVYVGSTERSLMGYNLSGQLVYLETETGKVLGNVDIIPNMEWIKVLQIGDKTLTLGKKDNTYSLFNRLNGELIDQMEINGLLAYQLDTNQGTITYIKNEKRNSFFYKYRMTQEGFEISKENLLVSRDTNITTLVDIGDMTVMGTNDGSFFQFFPETEEYLPFFDEYQLAINDLEILDNSLYLCTRDQLIRLESPFFDHSSSWADLKKVHQFNQMYPNRGLYLIEKNNDALFAFSNSRDMPAPLLKNNEEGFLDRIPALGDKLINAQSISILDQRIMSLGSTSEINIFDMDNGETLFNWYSPSLVQEAFLSEDTILLGKSGSPGNTGVLKILNISNGEITPVNDPYFFILDISRIGNKIYILGLREDDGDISTELSYISIEKPDLFNTIFSVPKEDYDSKIFSDELDNIYVSISGLGFIYYNGRRAKSVETDNDIKDMVFWGEKAVFLYDNQTLGIWDLKRNEEKFQLNFFSDLSWMAVASDNSSYFYTPDAKDNFSVYRLVRR